MTGAALEGGPAVRRFVVLAGGLSHERDVSLQSGRRVSEALRHHGVDVQVLDVGVDLLDALRDDPPDCVLPLLHGETGENGALREVLGLVGVPYVGSDPQACRLAFDKPVAKSLVARAGVRTPQWLALPAETFRELGAAAVMAAVLARLGLPLAVKPARGGSALGCSVVRTEEELPGAMVACFAYDQVALVERFVVGTEVAVTVLADPEPRALPPVEIRPDSGVYDYASRYTAGATEFVVPAEIPPAVEAVCAEVAVTAHTALGLRHLSRSDLLVDADDRVWFLEVNVAPGMTETSLVPLSIEAAGLDVGAVHADLAADAVAAVGDRPR
ncbi:D-alanine--D-alanine ligase [soil metagenome]